MSDRIVAEPAPARTAASPLGEVAAARVRTLADRTTGRRAVVGVVHPGYLGFPLAQRIAESGFTTVGFDINDTTVKRCRAANRFNRDQAVRSMRDLTTVLRRSMARARGAFVRPAGALRLLWTQPALEAAS